MTLDEYNSFCASLPATSHVVQWGASHVWKVGGKVFAVASRWGSQPEGVDPDEPPFVTFKTSPMSFDILKDQPGCRPAPYLASRGMKWIQRTGLETLDDAGLQDYLRESHRLAGLNLSKKRRIELGLATG